MKIGGTGGFNIEDLLKQNQLNPFGGAEKTDKAENADKKDELGKIDTDDINGASKNSPNNSFISDRENFTDENEIQEIDLDDFEDDF